MDGESDERDIARPTRNLLASHQWFDSFERTTFSYVRDAVLKEGCWYVRRERKDHVFIFLSEIPFAM